VDLVAGFGLDGVVHGVLLFLGVGLRPG
jgi:hypothetical protein